jgi:hypothetical protein
MKELKKRWKIESNFQLVLLFIVFAITGSTSALLSKPVCMWLGIIEEDFDTGSVRLLIIFPLYQVLLVLIGSLLGNLNFGHLRKDAKVFGFLFKE